MFYITQQKQHSILHNALKSNHISESTIQKDDLQMSNTLWVQSDKACADKYSGCTESTVRQLSSLTVLCMEYGFMTTQCQIMFYLFASDCLLLCVVLSGHLLSWCNDKQQPLTKKLNVYIVQSKLCACYLLALSSSVLSSHWTEAVCSGSAIRATRCRAKLQQRSARIGFLL